MPGTITTDHYLGRRGAAPSSVASGLVALYFKTDGLPYIKNELGTEQALLTDAVGASDKILDDNVALAWRVRESTNLYLGFNTSDGAEVIQLGDSSDVAALRLRMEAGSAGWDMTSQGQAIIDAVGALDINSSGAAIRIGHDAVNQPIQIGTAGNRAITIGDNGGTTALGLAAGSGGLSLDASAGVWDCSVLDNNAGAWLVHQGAQDYLLLVTTDGSEQMAFGNVTTNPDYNFLGSGQTTFSGAVDVDGAFTISGAGSYNQTVGAYTYNVGGSIYSVTGSQFKAIGSGGGADAIRLQASAGGGIDIDAGTNGYTLDSSGSMVITGADNLATMWQLKEGANSYIKATSTNGSELLTFGEKVLASKDAQVDGIVSTRHGVASGLLAEVGGTIYRQDDVSNVISNITAETLFNKASADMPAGSLDAGRRLRIHAVGTVPSSEAGSQPLTIRVRLHSDTGPVNLNIMAIIAADTETNDIWEFDIWLTVRTSGAAGTRTLVVSGGCGVGQPGVLTLARKRYLGAGDFDATKAYRVEVTAQWTNQQAANQVRMDDLTVELH
jgi:hypothetical protein